MGRSLILIVFSVISLSSCPRIPEIRITIKGKVLNADKSTTIKFGGEEDYITKLNPDKTFEIKGTLPSPGTMLFYTDRSNFNAFYMGEGEVYLTLEEFYPPGYDTTKRSFIKIVSVTGSPETVAEYQFKLQWEELVKKYAHLSRKDSDDSLRNAMYPSIKDYITAHPNGYLSADLIRQYPFTLDQRRQLLPLVDRNVNPWAVKNTEADLRRAEILKPGTKVADWESRTIDGATFSLYSVKAKYILLEFWASWCIGCRQTNPALVKLYNKYHSLGFEVVGISEDTKKKDWTKAIEKDKLHWLHVSDHKGSSKTITSLYDIVSIPYNILLNSNYEVVAINIRPEGLTDKLKELLPIEN